MKITKAVFVMMLAGTLFITACSDGKKYDISTKHDKKATPAATSDSEIIQNLQKGGYVVYFRHAQTEADYADQIEAVMGDCATQRSLSEAGWNQAKIIGAAFKKYGIAIDNVYSSQYCRAWQTADLAFGRHEKTADLNFYPAEEYTDEQFAQMRENVMPYLIKIPQEGKNTVIVGHDDVFESASGIYPEPQGVGYILKPNGETFEIVDHLEAEEWGKL